MVRSNDEKTHLKMGLSLAGYAELHEVEKPAELLHLRVLSAFCLWIQCNQLLLVSATLTFLP